MAKRRKNIQSFAEDLGRLLGTARGKADKWLAERKAIAENLQQIRDTATELLNVLGRQAERKLRTRRARRAHRRMSAKARALISDFPQLLRAAGAAALWCGQNVSPAYRFALVFEWGRSKVITVMRTNGTWRLEAAQFKHPKVAPFTVDKRVTKTLSDDAMDSLVRALHEVDFWWLEPVVRVDGCIYDGPMWVIEGRSEYGYHAVERGCAAIAFKDAGRHFLELAGLPGEQNTSPWEP